MENNEFNLSGFNRPLILFLLPLIVCLVGLLPLVGSPYHLHIAIVLFIYVPLALGQNLILGNSGQFSMGHAAFYGIGAYVTAIAARETTLPSLLVVLLSIGAAVIVGVVTGLPAIRVSGDYLFIVTIGLNLIFLDIVLQWSAVTGGPVGIPGIPRPRIGILEFSNQITFYYLSLAAAALGLLSVQAVTSSRFGKVIEAVRDDPIAAVITGINPTPVRVAVFAIGAGLAGLSGSLLAYFLGFVGPSDFGVDQSLLIFQMAIIGGLGSTVGSVAGAVIMVGLFEILRPLLAYRLGIGGSILIALMILRPEGMFGRVKATTIGRS
jgi:branched-chain amino acid transport system permease protein